MINEISVKLILQIFIYKISTSFDKNFDPLIMNSRIEVEIFEPGPTFENNIRLVPDQDGPFFYTRSHFGALQNCALHFSKSTFSLFSYLKYS